jgi:hypothetical protein
MFRPEHPRLFQERYCSIGLEFLDIDDAPFLNTYDQVKAFTDIVAQPFLVNQRLQHSTVTASAFSKNVGWFFYDDRAKGGTSTVFHGFVDGNGAKNSMKDLGPISTSPVGKDPLGGDFVAALTGGDAGGYLVPTRAQVTSIKACWIKP